MDTVTWRADEKFRTASSIKTANHVAVMRRARLGAFSLDDHVKLAEGDLVGGSGVHAVLRPGLFPRAFVDIPEPGDPPGPGCPWLAHKTGYVDGWLPTEGEVAS
jgi:hypothetical protein